MNRACLHDLNISTTRAYTAIEAGYASVQNFTIDRVQISDKDQSAISIYQGTNVHLNQVDITAHYGRHRRVGQWNAIQHA